MERTVEVVPEAGLHARPASTLVQTANRFDADVSIGRADDDETVSAASMLSVSGLNVAHGETVRVVAEGPDAADALEAVCSLLTTELDDGDAGDAGGETE